MNAPQRVLEFSQVSLPAGGGHDAGPSRLDLQAAAGDLVLLRPASRADAASLADAAEGLLAPSAGRVAFCGRDWASMTPDEAVAARARIGRVFHGPAWVSNLDVDENVTLRERHFTSRAAADIEAEAVGLARAFGLADLPRRRPAWAAQYDLARSQWVRALLGRPVLLLLDHPEEDVPDEGLAALRPALDRARGHGAAIVWFTSDPRVWNDSRVGATARYEARGADIARV
jgi:ABC-type lipoprotein export system ATPase subunit